MKKQGFLDKAKTSIDDLDSKIAELKIKMNKASDKTKDTYLEQLEALVRKKNKLELKYLELSNMTENKWEDSKETFKTSMESLKDTMRHLFD